ncbi:hypothetical protein [Derxia gummosa]|uniref:Uncharacterized protein n=1 Tax=Derxia gummosa DSM 723 TaxID=1121388 RepID=A0A9U5C2N2_9BURK|nr:hypothetical protein [Derxia gummosa]
MDPQRQRLAGRPRSLSSDAHFTEDRSTTAVTRTVDVVDLDAHGNPVRPASVRPTGFAGFTLRHVLASITVPNPLPHACRLPGKGAPPDPAVAGWQHNVNYTCFFNARARTLVPGAAAPRLQVRLLFGTGTEFSRHGVCSAVEGAADPVLLIVILGIEPTHEIEFFNPARPADRLKRMANNRWGVGITTASIERAITTRYGRLASYDVTVAAAFSTGYLGLQDSIGKRLFAIDALTRVVLYDCLYGTLRPALDQVRALRGTAVGIVAYVVTGGGNSFRKGMPETFANLALGGIAGWHYINLMGNPAYHAVASARVVAEGRAAPGRILDPLDATYAAAHDALVARMPARHSFMSDARVVTKLRGGTPAGATALASFAADKTNAAAIRAFFARVGSTRHCISRAQLLGWVPADGEEWHDLLLVEFAWEMLG